jgi:hypothetical protein
MVVVNLYVGWIAILVGLVAGAGIGGFFHRDEWLGGYASWRRRMLRLVHISLVGTGLLNVAFALSCGPLAIDPPPLAASVLFVIGAVTMPTVCLLAAWWPAARRLFFVPVLSLILATADFLGRGLLS